MSFVAPCKGCDKRNAHCHSSCEEYKTWCAELDEKNARRVKAKKIETDFININVNGVDKAFKKRNFWGRCHKKRVGQ